MEQLKGKDYKEWHKSFGQEVKKVNNQSVDNNESVDDIYYSGPLDEHLFGKTLKGRQTDGK